MSVESRLNTILENAGLTVYGVRAPDEVTFPYAVFSKITSGRVYSHCGYSEIARPRMQIEVYARTYDDAKVMSAAVIDAIEANLPGSTLRGEFDDELSGTYRIINDFLLNYKEEIT